jgi:hypothetical protein
MFIDDVQMKDAPFVSQINYHKKQIFATRERTMFLRETLFDGFLGKQIVRRLKQVQWTPLKSKERRRENE